MCLLALFMTLSGTSSVWADELTVFDGTESSTYYPVHGNYADTEGSLSEFIVPSTALSDMNGCTISKMTFYISSVAAAKWTSTFTVYMKEIEGSVYESSSAIGDDGATVVYVGELDGTASTMDVDFTNNFDYNGGNLLIGFKVTTAMSVWKSATFVGETQSENTAFRNKNSNTREKFLPKTTFTYSAAPVSGPVLAVKDGSTKLTSPYAYNFGLATAGTTKVFTLSNPGNAAVEGLDVVATGDFGATLSATSIAAGGEATLTVTMPDATSNGTITLSSTTDGIDNFVFNVSGTVRDPNKVYESGFASLPDDWTTTGSWDYSAANGAYTTVWYLTSNARLITPKLTIAEGEKFFVEAKGYSTSNTSYQHLQMQYSADGTTWTNFDAEPSLDPSNWNTFEFTGVPAGNYYIAINASQADIRMFYGGELPNEPKMVVTQPTSLAFGVVDKDATAPTKTFTIANTGKATLSNINVTSANSVFTITNAPTTLAAGASQEVTITMLTANAGALSSLITVSATDMPDATFTVTGCVKPAGMPVEDFASGLPANWTNASWTFANGEATGKSSSAYLTTPKLSFSAGDFIIVKAKRYDSDTSDYLTVQGSSDNGSTWTAYNKKLQDADGLTYPDFGTIVLSDIPTTVNKIRFVGFYAIIDEIYGLNYAPILSVTTGDPAVAISSPANYDFGECAADATVTYNFANVGAGTINITNVAITGDGATAYSTNWTTSVAAPFDLVITRTYDANRTTAQDATVTVTTSEGDFVINVTGTDKAANAPELAVSTNAINFGKVTADAVETVTVTNNGTGSMDVTIASDSEDFTVSAASLTGIGAGESKTFDITFKYGTPYGVKNGNVTVTPTYDANAAQTITVTGKAKDPATWSEDFAGNVLPTGWEAGANWTIANGKANAAYAYGTTTYLTTPALTVSATTDELTFDYAATGNYVSIKIQMSKDGAAFTDLHTISGLDNGDAGSYTITGLEAGDYQFRFANDDYNLSNFEGFQLKVAAAHEAQVKTQTIPVTGNQYVEYTASVGVKVTGANDEQLTVKFFIGDTQYGESVVKNVASSATETFEVTFAPTVAVSGDAYFTIESDDIAAFESDKVAVAIAAATVYDEAENPTVSEGTIASLVFKYTAKNGWNTICTPFALTSDYLTRIFGTGWKAYEFKSYSDGALGFQNTTTFYAGYPYIVYVETAAIHADGVKLQNVEITKTTAQYDQSSGAYFRGTYAPIAAGGWTKNAETDVIYGVTAAGKIAKAGASASMKGFRAYFDLPAGATARLAIYDDATGITTILDAKELNNDGKVYNLNGQRVENAHKGLYIVNGKKVVVK